MSVTPVAGRRPAVPGDPQDVLSVRAAVAGPRGWARPGPRGGRPFLTSKHLALPRPHRAQPVHDEGHGQSSLHPRLGSPSRSWVHFPKALGCQPPPLGRTGASCGRRAAAPMLGQSGQRRPPGNYRRAAVTMGTRGSF